MVTSSDRGYSTRLIVENQWAREAQGGHSDSCSPRSVSTDLGQRLPRCPFMFHLRFAALYLRPVYAARQILAGMADFFAVLGTVAFVLVFFGLIWALDRI